MIGQQRRRAGIWICGEWHPLAGNVRVVTFRDDPYWDYRNVQAPPGVERERYLLPRRARVEGVGTVPVGTNLEYARQATEVAILHTDGLRTARLTQQVLIAKGLSTHFIIDWDGTLYQCADPGTYVALHAAEQNRRSVGIDLNNDLPELHGRHKGQAYRHPEEADPKLHRRPVSEVMRINGARVQSYGYTDPQYITLIELIKVVCSVLDIPMEHPVDERGEVIASMLDDPFGFRGIAAHWHTSANRWDPGPGFDWQRLYHALRGEHNSFPMLTRAGQNVADLLAPELVHEAANELYRNNERGGGGYYPIGINQNWHGGIHLHGPRGREVHAMVDGVLVAARFGQGRTGSEHNTPLGSNNFVLLRHDIPMPRTETLRVFSLFMHLENLDTEHNTPPVEWLRKVVRLHEGEEREREEALDLSALREDDPLADIGLQDYDDPLGMQSAEPYLEVGRRLAALRRGQVALFDLEPEDRRILVPAGETIGQLGMFDDGDGMKPMVHVEVFADGSWQKAIDMGTHARFWVEIEEDVGRSLRIETDDILGLFTGTSRRRHSRSFFQRKNREVLPTTIEDFFAVPGENETAREWLRKAITRHVSEWSDQVNWVKALADAQTWAEKTQQFDRLFRDRTARRRDGVFTREIRRFLPFVWLNSEVAEHIGLRFGGEWNGLLYHFHPLYFMLWLTFNSSSRVQALSRGMSARRLRQERERRRREDERRRIEGASPDEAEDFPTDDETWVTELEEDSPEEVLRDFWGRPAPDEWRPPD